VIRTLRLAALCTGALAGCCALVLVALHFHHRRVLDMGALEHDLAGRAAHARRLTASLRERDASARLRSLGLPADEADTVRLIDVLAGARIQPPGPAAPPPPNRALTFEFDGADRFPMRGDPGRLRDGILALEARPDEPLVSGAGFQTPPETLSEISVRIRLERGRSFTLGWARRRLPAWPDNPDHVDTFRVDVVPGGDFHTYHIDAAHGLRLAPGKRIRTLFLIPSDTPGDRVEIDWIRVLPKRAAYAHPVVGITRENPGRDLRPAIHVSTPREISFRLRVPPREPRLDASLSVLNEPVDWTIRIEAGDESETLLSQRSGRTDAWDPVRLDLSRWAGRDVVLRVRADGAPGAIGFLGAPRISGVPEQRGNLLIVVEDTFRADGLQRAHTPTKDRLARQGTVFTRAISQATKTRPSVPSYLTSLFPSTTGVWNFHDRLSDGFLTLAEILGARGWETASFVQNTNAGPAAGLQQGFDRVLGQKVMGWRPDTLYEDRALAWIAERRDRNWLVYLHALDPHGTYDPPPPHDRAFREAGPGTPVARDERLDPDWVEAPSVEGRRLLYDGEIVNNDEHFGHFLEKLDELGALADTTIVFFSDHGEHQGEHGLWEHAPPGFASVLHVPLMLWNPGRVPAGQRVREPVSLLDVVPTLLELVDVPADGLPLQGESLLPLLGPSGAPRNRAVVSEEAIAFDRSKPERVRGSIFFDRWHFLYSRHEGEKRLRIFDVEADPGETRPALPWLRFDPWLERGILAALRDLKQADLELGAALTRRSGESVAMDPEAREQLRALGYIE
jgi:arylsulfatase A-like enzyme